MNFFGYFLILHKKLAKTAVFHTQQAVFALKLGFFEPNRMSHLFLVSGGLGESGEIVRRKKFTASQISLFGRR